MPQDQSRPPTQPQTMPFFSHLDELRSRLLRVLWFFLAACVGCYFIAPQVMAWLRTPLFAALPEAERKLYFTHLFESFLTHLKITGVTAFFAVSPYFFWELWAFVSPGLYPREKKYSIPFIAAATSCFLGGAAFAYYVLFPLGFKYFVTFGSGTEVPLLTMDSYYGTVLKLMLLFGLAFELPVLTSLLGFLGVVSAEQMRGQRRNATLGIAIVSAFVAPPDALSMILLGAPLVALYEVSIWVVQWFQSKRALDSMRDPATPTPPEADPWLGRSSP